MSYNSDAESLPESLKSIPNVARPLPGVLTAGQPNKTEFDALVDEGYTTIINTRTRNEPGCWDEASRAEQLGVAYHQFPISGPGDLTRETVESFDQLLSESDGDVCVHCGSSNRVGALFALRAAWLDGKSEREAIEIGKDAGLTRLKKAVQQRLSK